MSAETDADRLAFFDLDDFAVCAVWKDDNANVKGNVKGQFRNEFVDALNVESQTPTFQCRASDISGIANGHTMTIDSTDYTVYVKQPDGTGVTTLILEEV